MAPAAPAGPGARRGSPCSRSPPSADPAGPGGSPTASWRGWRLAARRCSSAFQDALWVVPASEVRQAGVAGAGAGGALSAHARDHAAASSAPAPGAARPRAWSTRSSSGSCARSGRGRPRRGPRAAGRGRRAAWCGCSSSSSAPRGQGGAPGRRDLGRRRATRLPRGPRHSLHYEQAANLRSAIEPVPAGAAAAIPTTRSPTPGSARPVAASTACRSAPERVELARKASLRALEVNDLLAPVHVTLGIDPRRHRRMPRRRSLISSRALALDPASTEALREKAAACEAIGQPAEAEGSSTSARSSCGRRTGATTPSWARFYYRRARYAEAEAAFSKVIELVPDNARGYASLGAVLHEAGGRDPEAVGRARAQHGPRPELPGRVEPTGLIEFEPGPLRGGRCPCLRKGFGPRRGATTASGAAWGISYHWSPGEREEGALGAGSAPWRSARSSSRSTRGTQLLMVGPRRLPGAARGMLGGRPYCSEARPCPRPDDARVQHAAAAAYEEIGDRAAALALVRRALEAGYPRSRVEDDPGLGGAAPGSALPARGCSGQGRGFGTPQLRGEPGIAVIRLQRRSLNGRGDGAGSGSTRRGTGSCRSIPRRRSCGPGRPSRS